MKKILCVCFSATYQRSVLFDSFTEGEVNRSRRYSLYASGKAVNSARVLNQLEKGCAITVCPLGNENDQEFIALAQNDGLGLEYVSVPGKIRECWTLMDSSRNVTTELVVGEPPAATELTENYDIKMLRLITEKLTECDAMILAGSRQGIWPQGFYADICGIALDNGKLVLADFTGQDLLDAVKRAVPSVIKINAQEYERTFGQAPTQENLCAKSRELNNIIVITRGTDSTLAADHGTFYECPTLKVKAINPIACGDSFNAGFVHEYLATADLEKSLQKATWCAAQNAASEVPGSING
ncbi:MAG: hypothetical protein J5726_10545 [Treponema sp.]|nr:hypothetical protein [Treponema sp.]